MFSNAPLRFMFVAIAAFSGFIGYAAAHTSGELYTFTAYPDGRKLPEGATPSLLDILEDVRRANEALFLDEPGCYPSGCPQEEEEEDDPTSVYGKPKTNGIYGQGSRYHIGAPKTRNR